MVSEFLVMYGYDMVRLMEKFSIATLRWAKIADSILSDRSCDNFDNLLIAPWFVPGFSAQKYEDVIEKITNAEKILNDAYEPLKIKVETGFEFASNYSENEYCDDGKKTKEYITNGDIFQVLPSQRFSANFDKKTARISFFIALCDQWTRRHFYFIWSWMILF